MEITRRSFLKVLGLSAFLPSVSLDLIQAPPMPLPQTEWAWFFDPAIGGWTCEPASRTLLQAAIDQSVFSEFVEIMEKPFNLPVYLPCVSRLAKPSAIAVREFGRGIECFHSKLPKRFNPDDLIQKQIIWQMSGTLDKLSSESLKSVAFRINTPIAQKLAPEIKNRDEQKWVSAERFLERMGSHPHDQMFYIAVGGTRFLRRVKVSSMLTRWREYLNPGDVLDSKEVGVIGNTRWIECKDLSCLGNEALVFGDHSLQMIQSQAPHLRAGVFDSCDVLAWCGMLGFGAQNVVRIAGNSTRKEDGWEKKSLNQYGAVTVGARP